MRPMTEDHSIRLVLPSDVCETFVSVMSSSHLHGRSDVVLHGMS